MGKDTSAAKGKMKLGWKILLWVLVGVISLLSCVVLVFTIAEYRPKQVEEIAVNGEGTKVLKEGDSFSIFTWNTGFGALDSKHDLFSNGGVEGSTDTKEGVMKNLAGMQERIASVNADIVLLQEVDFKASRSFSIDQAKYFHDAYGGVSTQALNFNAMFVPLPLKSPMGAVKSGLQTLTQFQTESASRISLPNVHKWPISTCHLKRCIMPQVITLADTDKKLVIVNVHLEAYTGEAGKKAQSKIIHDYISAEYAKGNYIIVGGDFNQTIPGTDVSKYYTDPNNSYFQAPVIDTTELPEGFGYYADDSAPTCRFADSAYNHDWATTELYVIDGFLVSPNIQVNSVKTFNEEFEYTDHNPVSMSVTLIKE